MANIVEFTYRLQDQMSGKLLGVAKVAVQVSSTMDKTKTSTTAAGDAMNKMNNQAGGLTNTFNSLIKAGVAYFGITQAIGAAKAFVNMGLDMEQTRAKFEVLLGSVDKGNKMIADVNKMANITPFENADLIKSSEVMLNFGISSEKILPTLSMIGDVSMGNKEKLSGLTLAYSQVASTGRLMGQDLLQMINQGFNPLLQMSKTTGKSMGELKKDMEGGKISFAMVEQAFKDATAEGGQFHGMMDKMSQTGMGKMSTFFGDFKDKLTQLAEKLDPFIVQIFDFGIAIVANFDQIASTIWAALYPIRLIVSTLISLFTYFKTHLSELVLFGGSVATVAIIIWSANLATKGWTISTILQYKWLLMQEKLNKLLNSSTIQYAKNILFATASTIKFTAVAIWQAIKGIGALIISMITGGATSVKFAAISSASFATFAVSAKTACKAVSVAISSIPIIGWIAAALAVLIAFTVKLRELGASWTEIITSVFFGLPGMVALYFYKTNEKVRAGFDGLVNAAKEIFSGLGTFMSGVFEGIFTMIQGVFNPKYWFDENYSISTGLDKIKNAAKDYGRAVAAGYREGRDDSLLDSQLKGFDMMNGSKTEALELAQKKGLTTSQFEGIWSQVLERRKKVKDIGRIVNPDEVTTVEPGIENVNNLTSGGSKQTNVTINLRNLIENYQLNTQTFAEGVDQGTQMLIEALLRVVNSANRVTQ
ncbi:MAG: tape measure protein [Bacteroidales bacterium]|nr:tape measure protein [Bacteroidales bacterium]